MNATLLNAIGDTWIHRLQQLIKVSIYLWLIVFISSFVTHVHNNIIKDMAPQLYVSYWCCSAIFLLLACRLVDNLKPLNKTGYCTLMLEIVSKSETAKIHCETALSTGRQLYLADFNYCVKKYKAEEEFRRKKELLAARKELQEDNKTREQESCRKLHSLG